MHPDLIAAVTTVTTTAAETEATTLSDWIAPAVIAALVSAAVALLTVAWNGRRARLDRQRQLFAAAFDAAMTYREYIYIVRRRAKDEDGKTRHEISRELSSVQAKLNSYQAQLQVEAPRVGKRYAELVDATKRIAGPLIKDAWDRETIESDNQVHAPDVDLSALDNPDTAYLEAVADHLSPIWAPVRARLRRRRP